MLEHQHCTYIKYGKKDVIFTILFSIELSYFINDKCILVSVFEILSAYTSLEQLNSEVSNSLINPVMGITSSSSTKASSTHASSSRDYKRMEEESPLFVGERKAPPRQPQSVHPSW